jgi:hypothetical protein
MMTTGKTPAAIGNANAALNVAMASARHMRLDSSTRPYRRAI